MAGTLVARDTERLAQGEPSRALYVVASPDPGQAVDIIKSKLEMLDETLTPLQPLGQQVLDFLGLKPGEIKLLKLGSE